MFPILFQIGPVNIYTYGVLAATGILIGLWYARHQARVLGLDPDRVWNLGVYMVLAAFLVAKLWLIAADFGFYREHPSEIYSLAMLQSGGTFYGGVLGALLVAGLYTWFAKLPLLLLLDAYCAGVPLGHAIGRLGCYAAGCCWGKPTTMPWGVQFSSIEAARLVGTPIGSTLHPTQLYESAAEFMNFIILVWLARRQSFRGQLFATFLLLYGFERGIIEFLRGDPDRTLFFGGAFSLMQVVSIAMILLGAWLWWTRANRPVLAPAQS
jgi:phosphatidylglycerol:prolipoprotein diacylglycerol transferase